MKIMPSSQAIAQTKNEMLREQGEIQKLDQQLKKLEMEAGHKRGEVQKVELEVNRHKAELQKIEIEAGQIKSEIQKLKTSIQQSTTEMNQMAHEMEKEGKIKGTFKAG